MVQRKTIYYPTDHGIQSMAAVRADSVFFPGGDVNDFQLKTEIRGNKQQYPEFKRFVQKSNRSEWYESCYLTNDGIGDHLMLETEEFIYYNND